MSIQVAGSKSLIDRRQRRLVVHSDDPGADGAASGEDPQTGVSSELIDSDAAVPWVPLYEWRIWTYAAILSLVVASAAFAVCRPTAFRPELGPVTKHLLQGPRPVLAVLIQTTFWFLAAQLAMLIGWYRSRCQIDFRGRYQVWPWAVIVFGIAAICSATGLHQVLGQVASQMGLLSWRAEVVSWLLPANLAATPLILLVDRDARRSRSSLYMLRLAWLIGIASSCLELFAPDLGFLPWISQARIILPMAGTASLFVGLWLHARIVAYVCSEPPVANYVTALDQLSAAWKWIVYSILRDPEKRFPVPEYESDVAPQRTSKKGASEDEDGVTPKRKRRAPARRTSKPRTRTKVVAEEETEEEPLEDQSEAGDREESEDPSSGYEAPAEENDAESTDWNEEPEPEFESPSSRSTRNNYQTSNVSKYPDPRPQVEPESDASDGDDDDAGDTMLRRDSGLTADQLKGLSKRQKRELRRQAREQQRNQRR